MRTLLRDTMSGLYFQGPDKWTNDPDRAFDFRFTDRALKYAAAWNLDQVEIAFTFNDPEQVAAVALGKAVLHLTTV